MTTKRAVILLDLTMLLRGGERRDGAVGRSGHGRKRALSLAALVGADAVLALAV